MREPIKFALIATAALSVAACSGATEEEPAPEIEAVEIDPAVADTDAAATESTEVFEVCDEAGNRYPSEADAEAAGLDRAEYGATFCEYIE